MNKYTITTTHGTVCTYEAESLTAALRIHTEKHPGVGVLEIVDDTTARTLDQIN